jgi:hypothetical protein
MLRGEIAAPDHYYPPKGKIEGTRLLSLLSKIPSLFLLHVMRL